MARPPLALGHHGSIKVTRDRGQWVARCRFRDLDGVTRRVARWGSSKTAAQHALQDEIRERRGEQTEILRSDRVEAGEGAAVQRAGLAKVSADRATSGATSPGKRPIAASKECQRSGRSPKKQTRSTCAASESVGPRRPFSSPSRT